MYLSGPQKIKTNKRDFSHRYSVCRAQHPSRFTSLIATTIYTYLHTKVQSKRLFITKNVYLLFYLPSLKQHKSSKSRHATVTY